MSRSPVTFMGPPTVTKTLCGIETQIVIHNYADRILVIVTQLGKVGHLLQVSVSPAAPLERSSDPDSNVSVQAPPSVTVMPLFGTAPSEHLSTLHSIYATQIAMHVWTSPVHWAVNDRRKVVVGLAFKKPPGEEEKAFEHEQATFKGVMQMIDEFYQQN